MKEQVVRDTLRGAPRDVRTAATATVGVAAFREILEDEQREAKGLALNTHKKWATTTDSVQRRVRMPLDGVMSTNNTPLFYSKSTKQGANRVVGVKIENHSLCGTGGVRDSERR